MLELNQDMIDEVKSWMCQAGEIALTQQSRVKMYIKEDNSPVTDAEFEIESLLIDKIKKYFPGHTVISEEQGMSGDNLEHVWALDPVDGTRAFLGRLPAWGISLGLVSQGKARLGFFYMPAVKEFFYAWDEGAFWQDEPLPPLDKMPYKDPLLFLGTPSNAHLEYEIDYPRVRALGSTAAHMAYVCRGISIGYISRKVYIWDLAGLLPFYPHLGIHMEYFSGAPFEVRDILNKKAIPEALLLAPEQWFTKIRSAIRPKK